MKKEGSGSISQRHGSLDPDPDPHQNVMDPQHWFLCISSVNGPEHWKYRYLLLGPGGLPYAGQWQAG
jgi:hypothetical protein